MLIKFWRSGLNETTFGKLFSRKALILWSKIARPLIFSGSCPDYVQNTSGLAPEKSDGKNFVRICQNLAEIPGIIPKEITAISIQGNADITSLAPNVFKENSHCIYLLLAWNRIDKISPWAFTGLNALKRLFLQHNRIKALENGTFSGLTGLERLDLSFNYVHVIDTGTFSELAIQNSLHLDLANNALESLSRSIFASSLEAERIEFGLSGNPLECDKDLCWLKWAEQERWLTWIDPSKRFACLNMDFFLDDKCHSKYQGR